VAATWCGNTAAFAGQPGTESAAKAATVGPRPPTPTETMKAYKAVEAWVRAWGVPPAVDEKGLPAVGGASVILRLNGDVIGRASEFSDEGAHAIVMAARAAMGEAARRLPVENDALAEEMIQRLAADVTVSVELAGALIPLGGRNFDDAAKELSPGVDGVAARIGARLAPVFPSAMLMQSISGRMALSSAAAQAGNDAILGLTEMDKLIDEHGARFYRFRVTHLAQGAPGTLPIFLYRGGRGVQVAEITGNELNAMADRIAEHLLTRAWPGNEPYGMVGTYDPCRDVSEPRVAAPIEQLTACLALVKYARLIGGGGEESPRGKEMMAFVDRLMSDLAKVDSGEQDGSADAASAAAWVVVSAERAASFRIGVEFDAKCRRTVLGSFMMQEGFEKGIAPTAQPLVALALVRMAAAEKPGKMRDEAVMLADHAVRRVLRDATAGDLVGRMPWLGWAEVELAAVKGEKEVGSVVALREMRTMVWEHQVSATDRAANDMQGGGTDMVGGIVFDAGAKGATVLPTWQTARPLVFVAGMMRDERFTKTEDWQLELARLIGALRFLRQLQMDDGTAWMCQNRRKAMGGIRSSVWDQRMASDASAMTLMVVCEVLRGLGK
jgi:hypothetical protein